MALFMAIFTLLFAVTTATWSNTDVETHTACTTQYGPVKNTTELWLDYWSTDSYTTSAWSYFSKTELLTLKPSTTTLSATSTSTSYLYPADNWTTTVYTSTYYDTYQSTQTKTVSSTTTITVSQVETLTVPALDGFVAVASAYPSAAKKTNSWEYSVPDGWEVHDVFWTTEIQGLPTITASTIEPIVDYFGYSGYISRRSEPSAGQPLRVDCTETVQSNNFYTTSYITLSGPRATFTRTEVVATETSTFTVHTKPTAPPPTSVYTIEDTLWATNTSYVTETVTTTQTVSTSLNLQPAICNRKILR